MDGSDLCIIGKYPPIEGGVSKQVYWLARSLALVGHRVHIVTNAEEVEADYRMYLSDDDRAKLECSFDNGGGVRHYPTVATGNSWHIPNTNPFVTKLAALARDVVREHGCTFVHTSYLEPYAFAGALVSQWTGVPYSVQHAGSDIGRLAQDPLLRSAYLEVMAGADVAITAPSIARRLIAGGVRPERLFLQSLRYLPSEYFRPDGPVLDVNGLVSELAERGFTAAMRTDAPFEPSRPTIGIYGKPGPRKGTYQLIRALGLLRRKGLEFNFVALCGNAGIGFEHMQALVQEEKLDTCSFLLPFLPHWRVPEFLRLCTVVAFLENQFPIGIHSPVIPMETQVCARCLVVSAEVAADQWPPAAFVNGKTCLVVNDPLRPSEVAAVLESAIVNQKESAEIGVRGQAARYIPDDFRVFGALWERFATVAAERRDSKLAFAQVQDALARLSIVPREFQARDQGTEPLDLAVIPRTVHSAATGGSRTISDLLERYVSVVRRARFRRLWSRFIRVETAFSDFRAAFEKAFQSWTDQPSQTFLAEVESFARFLDVQASQNSSSLPEWFTDLVLLDAAMLRAAFRPLSSETFDSLNSPPKTRGQATDALESEMYVGVSEGVVFVRFAHHVNSLLNLDRSREPMKSPCDVAIVTEEDSGDPRILILGPALRVLVDQASDPVSVATLMKNVAVQLQADVADPAFKAGFWQGLIQLTESGVLSACPAPSGVDSRTLDFSD
jgi:glycosyltransferase involved in cell wall biosynthesis